MSALDNDPTLGGLLGPRPRHPHRTPEQIRATGRDPICVPLMQDPAGCEHHDHLAGDVLTPLREAATEPIADVVVSLRWGGKDGKWRTLVVTSDGAAAASEHRTTSDALAWAGQWLAGRPVSA